MVIRFVKALAVFVVGFIIGNWSSVIYLDNNSSKAEVVLCQRVGPLMFCVDPASLPPSGPHDSSI